MALMAAGLPVAFCFMLVNVVGVFIFCGGQAGLAQLILSILSSVSSFILVAIPMFIFMGVVMFESGMGTLMIDVLDRWLGRLPGRLGLLAVGGGTLFSVLSGSSIASVALLGKVLSPEMEKRGYAKPMSLGPILGSGGLAIIIPPSGQAVLLAALGSISVGHLLIGGVVPGLVIALFYATYIIVRCRLQASVAPSYPIPPVPLSKKLMLGVRYVLPLGLIVFLVLGLIFLGVTTPSEAAATGAFGSVILGFFYRRMNWEVLKRSILGTMEMTVMVFMIIAGAIAFSQILTLSGASQGLVELAAVLPLSAIALVVAMLVIVLILGTFMSIIPVMMITVPIYMPVIDTLGLDPVWFGILVLICLEMSGTTPPFGMYLFVMKGIAPPDTTMGDIIWAAVPFLLCDLAVVILCLFFPAIVTWLPGAM